MEIKNKDLEVLMQHLKTREKVNDFIYGLEELSKSVYLQDTSFEQLSGKVLDDETSKLLKNIIQENDLNIGNKSDVTEYIKLLKEGLEQIKVLKLTLEFAPSDKFVERLYIWVKENIGEMLVLDITVDKEILGGAVIVYEGKYIDMSLQERFNTVFNSENTE